MAGKLFNNGDWVTFYGTLGRVSYDGDEVYFCSNSVRWRGAPCQNRLGMQYSFYLLNDRRFKPAYAEKMGTKVASTVDNFRGALI